jgi:hypothetical protein
MFADPPPGYPPAQKQNRGRQGDRSQWTVLVERGDEKCAGKRND